MVRALGAFQLDGVAGNKRRRKPRRRCFFVTDHVCRGKVGVVTVLVPGRMLCCLWARWLPNVREEFVVRAFGEQ